MARTRYCTPSPSKRLAVYERCGYRCVHCGKQFTPPPGYTGRCILIDWTYRDKKGKPRGCGLEIDHIYPRILGGTNAIENLQALCTQCNARKGAKV